MLWLGVPRTGLRTTALDHSAILTFQHKDVKDLNWSDGKINNRDYNVYCLKNASNSKRACVRSGIWTHASMWRPETSTTEKEITPWVWRLRPLGPFWLVDTRILKTILSLALVRWQINNRKNIVYGLKNASNYKRTFVRSGFEPTPPCGDQKPQQLRRR